jgi:hypothetical protein
MLHMDSHQRPALNTTPANIENLNSSPDESLGSISNNQNETTSTKNLSNQTSLTTETTNTATLTKNKISGNSWMKFWNSQQLKETSFSNRSTSPVPLNNSANHHPEKQFKQQNGDVNNKNENPSSPSPVIHRSTTSKEPTTPNSSNQSSPRNSSRISGSFSHSPQSSASFANPLHPFKQQFENSPRSSPIPSSPIIQEKQNIEKILDENLGFHKNESNNIFPFERSISTDTQQSEFNSSLGSQTNLLDDDFYSNKPTLKSNSSYEYLSPCIQPTTIPETEQKSSTSPQQSNTASTSPNYNVTIRAHNASSKSQSKSVGSNLPLNRSQKLKNDMSKYFDGLGELRKDSKSEPSTPTTIGEIRKAVISKDVDPTVLKVREWTEGKKRNIRALLCSLSDIIWPECQWGGCQMNELITCEQVKKVYRKAIVYIHPDKLQGDPNQPLAKLIFVELNEAWSQFQEELNLKC